MKTLVVYYSRTGNNEKLARKVQEKLKADIEGIVDPVNRGGVFGFLRGGFEAMRKKGTGIKRMDMDPGDYELTVVVTPLWSGTLPPATRTFLEGNGGKFKEIALLSVSGSGEGNKRALADFEEAAGKKVNAALLLSAKADWKERLGGFISELRNPQN
jgi:multimeric flavodoxin WrbA